MLILYTGPGKGKTSAAVGQTIRARGQKLRTAFGQFLKKNGEAGEQSLLAELLGENFLAGGVGFYRRKEEYPAHRKAGEAVLAWARERLERGLDLLVLDEALYALGLEIVTAQELRSLLDLAAKRSTHVVLTGRNPPEWLFNRADLVTTMEESKHPFQRGQGAARGIEY